MGFPTINLEMPEGFDLEDGVYAVWVGFAGGKYMGALHFGSVPTFKQSEKSLEVFLLDFDDSDSDSERDREIVYQIEVVKRLRDVIKFESKEGLVKQIKKDVENVITALNQGES